MGSWNKTCAISNLHITYNTPVTAFILERQPIDNDMCYTTALYKPVPLPFYTTYDDYGIGRDSSGPFFDLLMDTLKNQLVEKTVGTNQYHDIAVDKASWNEGLFWRAIREQRLSLERAPDMPLNIAMIRNDVAYKIYNSWEQFFYKDGKSSKFKLNTLLQQIPLVMDKAKAAIKQRPSEVAPYFLTLDSLIRWEDREDITLFFADNYHFSRVVRIDENFFKLVVAGKELEAALLMAEYIKAKWLDNFMSSIRRMWTPGGFEGSQSQERNGYMLLTEAILDCLEKDNEFG